MLSRLVCSNISKINIRTFSITINNFDKKEYTDSEEWLYHSMESTKMGLSQKAIDELGELIYIEYSANKGDVVKEKESLVIVESVKSSNLIAAPYDCVVLGTNYRLEEDLTCVNESPECPNNSWIVKIDKIR
jgi:glycine cleavage system H lipoate-binding protein